jgi:flagellar biosynthesis protein FlhF
MEMKSELQTLRCMLEEQLSSLAWGSFARGEPRRVELIQRLMRFGMTAAQCRSIADAVAVDDADVDTLWSRSREVIARGLPLYQRDPMQEGGIIALVGPTGAGKTTTVAKLAAHYALRHGKRHVALVTIDNYRVGAHEQLRSYGRILDVPVRTADSRDELRSVLDDLADRSLVLIDTSGMSQHDSGLARQAELLDKAGLRKQVMLLLPATSRLSGLDDVITAFSPFAPDACIPTKVDETTCLGGVLSAAVTHQLPLAYVSDGQRVPEDLHPACAEDLVARAAHIMNRMGPRIDEDLVTLSFGKEIANANF